MAKQFLTEDFLLQTKTARTLYHEYAKDMPVYDYHCHLPADKIANDYRFDNPFNPNVRGIGKREIMILFPDCRFDFKLINLNPIIARPLAEFSWTLCEILEKIPLLRTHWLVIIKKKSFAFNNKSQTKYPLKKIHFLS